ncbi:hypothetical protein VaNZ11_007920 [Volvox africanus]|uniref:Uncharacterized protein n=1 Tax=Volvox africanus TaxID=51714 RepID=A0ABQ5S4W6_9CHLO|nr:hypothetical protein VaNZ11_007920 [Volvox africanus]
MGRFHGSLAEDLTAEAMIHGWEAVCKLWEASSVLDSCDLDGPAIDTADKIVQQHLRDALKLFETALDKFSCKIVYDIVGHAYNPILHELDRSDPEVEAFRQGSIGTLGGAGLNDLLCGAAVATVVRPGLEVTGIMRARPRVWVTLPSTRGQQTPQTGIAPVPAQHQQQLRFGSFAFKVPVLGAKVSSNCGQAQKSEAPRTCSDAVQIGNVKASAAPSSGADAATCHSEEQSGSVAQISSRTISPPSPRLAAQPACGASSRVSEHSTTQHGDLEQHHGAEESMGCATSQESSPAYVAATPIASGAMPLLPQPPQRPVASFTGAGPKGPLQLLLALRTGRRTGPVAVPATITAVDTKEDNPLSFRTGQFGTGESAGSELEAAVAGVGDRKTSKRSSACSVPAVKESPTGRLRKGTGAVETSGPRSGAAGARDAGSPGGGSHYRGVGSDDVDNDDDVCYQQYDTSTHYPATQPRQAVGSAVQQSQAPQGRPHYSAPVRAATTMVAATVSPPGAGSTLSANTVPRLAVATCGVSSSIGGGGQAGPVSSSERPTTACPDGRCNPAGPIPGPSLDRSASTATTAGAAVRADIGWNGGFESVKESPLGSTYAVSRGAPEINETSGSASGRDRTSTCRNGAVGAGPTRRSDSGGNGGNLNPARSAATAAAAAAAAPCGVPSSAALAAAAAVRAAVAAAAAANSRAGLPSSTALPSTTPRTGAVRAAPQPSPSSSATVIPNAGSEAGAGAGGDKDAAAASPPFAHTSNAAPGLPSPESKASGVEPGVFAGGTSGRPRIEAVPRRTPMPGAGKLAAHDVASAAAVAAAPCSGPGSCSGVSQGHGPATSRQGSRRQSETVLVAHMAQGRRFLAAVEAEVGDEDLGMSQPTLATPPTGHVHKTTSRSSGADLSAAAAARPPPPPHHHLFPRRQRSSRTLIVTATAMGNIDVALEPSRASGNPGRGAGRGARASRDRRELNAATAVTTTVADGGDRDAARELLRQQRHISRGRGRGSGRGTGLGIGQPLPPPSSKQQRPEAESCPQPNQQQQQQKHEQQWQHHDYQPPRLQQQRQQQEQHMGRTDRLSQVNNAHQREHYERHPPSDAPRAGGKAPPAHPHSAAAKAGVLKPGGGRGGGGGGDEVSAAALRAEESSEEASVRTARGVGGAGACGGEDDDAKEDEEQVEGEGCGDVQGAAGRRGGRGGGGWRGRWGLRRRGAGGGWRRRGAGGLVAGAGPTSGRPMPQ